MGKLTGKVVLVTGASKGLGSAMAKALAKEGAYVAVNYLKDKEAALAVKEEINRHEGQSDIFCFDVTDESAVKHGIQHLIQTKGTLHVVINNATGPQPTIPLEDQKWKDHLDQLIYFVKAPLILLKAALPFMKSQHFGRIINIGSEVVEIGNPEFGHYVAAKAAMLGLTRSWANEIGKFGITVNLIAPGWIPVERHKGMAFSDYEKYLIDLPMARQGTPADIQGLVCFLASEESSFITGQRIAVNGGKTF